MNSVLVYGCNLWRNAALVIIFLLTGLQGGLAAPGDLDPSFGVGGKTVTRFFNNGGIEINYPRAIALQPDGKMIVAGRAYSSQTSDDFALARYNPNGTLDAGFGEWSGANGFFWPNGSSNGRGSLARREDHRGRFCRGRFYQ